MFDPAKNVVHLVDGRLAPKSKTSRADVTEIVRSAIASGSPSGIVINFHGGLVSESGARETAELRLYPLYAERANAYPIFFVWESGLFEAPLNNLTEILAAIGREGIFREFVKKVGEWVLKKIPGGAGLKGAGLARVDEQAFRAEFDAWFRGERDAPPMGRDLEPGTSEAQLAAVTKGADEDEDELAEQVQENIEGDDQFREEIQKVANGLLPAGSAAPSTKGAGTTASTTSLISKEAAAELFDHTPGTRGAVSWFKVAKAVAGIVIRVVRRFKAGRGHGPYVTVVEEVLRALYIDKIGRIGWWDRMKGDTADAFRDGEEHGGTALLTELARQLAGVSPPPRITLVGHSTGAVYICNFLKAASRLVPDLQFDVVFEAPAVTHDLLAATAAQHASRIRNFRQFGMHDDRERKDAIVPIVYISSLLYFVSGMLEGEPDEPLAGMARFLDHADVYDPGDFPTVDACRRFYARYPNALVWSLASAGAGLSSDSHHHGDFDDEDPTTMASIQHILQHGF